MNKKPVTFLQTDPRWGSLDYSAPGEKTTIAKSGCGPTAAASLITTMTGKTFTPAQACKWALDHGFKARSQGTYYGYFKRQFAQFYIHCVQMNWSSLYGRPGNDLHNQVISDLKKGYYYIACMGRGNWTSSGHFVVVWWADSMIHIMDPASLATKRVKGDPYTFKSQVKYYFRVDARKFNSGQGAIESPVSEDKKEVDEDMLYYEKIEQVPSGELRDTVQDLVNKKIIRGNGDGLHLSEDMVRMLVYLRRANVI